MVWVQCREKPVRPLSFNSCWDMLTSHPAAHTAHTALSSGVTSVSLPGPPAPPQDVAVRAGPTPGTIQVCWKPPALSATGTSHGASVTGYGVYAKGQRVSDLLCHCHLPPVPLSPPARVTGYSVTAKGQRVSVLPVSPVLVSPPVPVSPLSCASVTSCQCHRL